MINQRFHNGINLAFILCLDVKNFIPVLNVCIKAYYHNMDIIKHSIFIVKMEGENRLTNSQFNNTILGKNKLIKNKTNEKNKG